MLRHELVLGALGNVEHRRRHRDLEQTARHGSEVVSTPAYRTRFAAGAARRQLRLMQLGD